MAIVVVGINERDVPLDVFEQGAVAHRDLAKALRILGDSPHLSEVVLLSTCLRTEIYAVVERFHDGVADIEMFYRSRPGHDGGSADRTAAGDHGSGSSDLVDHLFCWYDDAAIAHLFEVAAGIDSPVLGEGEILRQVRDAFDFARAEEAAGPTLSVLFRHAIEAGKRARTDTAIARGTTSLAHAAVALAADQLGGGLEGRSVLVIGAGEMGLGFLKALYPAAARTTRGDLGGKARSTAGASERRRAIGSPSRVVVANRTLAAASALTSGSGAEVVGLDDLEDALVQAEVVLTSTASPDVVVDAALVRRVMADRPGSPLLLVDVAVPRDVDPAVGALEGVSLLDVEDVRRFAEAQMATRRREVPMVRSVLAEELERYRLAAAGRSAAPVVAALRGRAEQIRQAELARHQAKLDALAPEASALVDLISARTVSKLLHEPSVRVKDAAGTPRGERLAEALRSLFDL